MSYVYHYERAYDDDYGCHGWVCRERFQPGFNVATGTTENIARLLSHDTLEHICTGYSPYEDEIVAIGAALYNRESDFTLGLSVEAMLQEHYDSCENSANCNSSVCSYIRELYTPTMHASADTSFEGKRMGYKRLHVLKLLSKGYNSASRRGRYTDVFYNLKQALIEALAKADETSVIRVTIDSYKKGNVCYSIRSNDLEL